jgi:multidrug efflux system membrane fusion protein
MTPRSAVRPVAALALACAIAGCSGATSRRSAAVPVAVATVERRSIPYEIEATGTVEPVQSAQVTSQVGGLVTKVSFAEGDDVSPGQMLFQIDARPYEAAMERAAAVLERDRALHGTAQLDLQRAAALQKQNLVPEAELQEKSATAHSLAATVRADSAALASAKLDLANATIRAPIGGRTGSLAVHVGDLVRENDNTAPLVTINKIRPIRVRFTVPQADLVELRRREASGLRVDASTGDDSTWVEGRLSFVDNAIDPQTGTVLLKGEFANADGRLWPGAFVRVRLRLYDESEATIVPATAVTNSQTGPYLYIVKADTTVEARPVDVIRTWRDYAVLRTGVEPGETVVTDGQLRLSPGSKALIRAAAGDSTP